MPALADITAITIDCAGPARLAEFYRKATGWEIAYGDEEFVCLDNGGPLRIAFQYIAGYRAPNWPDARKHAHLDLTVASPDLESAAEELIACGASKPEFQPGEGTWIVLTDPEGHPFCLVAAD
ncbi:VOC family protein [Embleya scabrispora]|uniref:VOC family protein n=1 Tax=Embleya scabrispora TaxID=159449 RepID=UPI0003740EA6|nr:VOC family protein [Embleya scabrispora]MYS84983.1 VOC family protein [Streptomyces sp. SID5474]